MTSVDVESKGGVDGTPQLMVVLAVLDVPVPITVGLLQVRVWVNMVADTFGATVFCIMGTANWVLQKLLLSCTITVHVPGMVVVVDVLPPSIMLGVTTPVNEGARKV